MTADPGRFARIKELLLRAREQPADAREAFVRDAAGDDDALAAEVLDLLGHEARPARIVEEGVLPAGILTESNHPERVGPYHIAGVLGEGGMGVVYRAVQEEPIRREVALKLVRRGLDTERVLRRFHWERQSLASLDHPNIASVLDAGDLDGRPWFVMPLVEGRPLTVFCDEERLGVDQRVDVFVEVCRAVQHAHQRGLLHRDLKPGNILVRRVQDGAVPTVIDFGIARSLQPAEEDGPALTLEGQRIGTPAYMSPEQLRGDESQVDTRSDVYALGVILYELLAGRHPWADSGEVAPTGEAPPLARRPSTAVDADATGERARERGSTPRDLVRKLRGDLDTICLMALRGEPERRYDSAAHLADDLVRYRTGRPVAARPDSLGYRLGKYVRRHPAQIAALGLLALLVAGSAGFFAWHAQRLETERDRAVAAETRAQAEAEAAGSMVSFLEGLFLLAEPGGEGGAGDLSMRELLAQGVRRVPTELEDEPYLQSRMLRAMGGVYHSINELAVAESLVTVALDRAESMEGDLRNPERAAALALLGSIQHDLGRYAAAEASDRQAVALYREIHGGDSLELVQALNALGISVQVQGRVEEGIAFVRESLEMQERLTEEADSDLAWGWGTLGYLNYKLGRMDESLEQLERALELAREVFGNQDHFELLYALNNYGGISEFLDRLDEAEPVLEEALAMCQRMYADSEHAALGRAYQNLARVRMKRGQLDDARQLAETGHAVMVRVVGGDHPRLANSFRNLARVARAQGRWADAEELAREGLRIADATLPAEHPSRQDVVFSLGLALLDMGRPEDAAPHLLAFHEWARETQPDGHWKIGRAANALGRCERERGRPAAAAELLATGHRILTEALGADHSLSRAAAQDLPG